MRHCEVLHLSLVPEYQLLLGAIALLDHLYRAMRGGCIAARTGYAPDWLVQSHSPVVSLGATDCLAAATGGEPPSRLVLFG